MNVSITAADYSVGALTLFQETMSACSASLAASGIEATLTVREWDAENAMATRDILEAFSRMHGDGAMLCLIANVTEAARREEDYNRMKTTLEYATLHLAQRATIAHIEPGVEDSKKVLDRIGGFIRSIGALGRSADDDGHRFGEYLWTNPFDKKDVTCRTRVLLVAGRSSP